MNDNLLQGKIAITGTGRCGTTFLMRLFTAYDPALTGYGSHDAGVLPDVQAGMEHVVDAASPIEAFWRLGKVWKDPGLTMRLPGLVAAGHRPDLVIVPVRDIADAAASRLRNNRPWFPAQGVDLSTVPRDRWPTWADQQGQEQALRAELGRIVEACAVHSIPLTVIPWDCLGRPGALLHHLERRPMFGGRHSAATLALGLTVSGFFDAHKATWGRPVQTWKAPRP